jgi:hypothetical protein
MKRPPFTPQTFRVHYRDGRVETVVARACLRLGETHVFYSEGSNEVLRVPVEAVLSVESSRPGASGGRRRRV